MNTMQEYLVSQYEENEPPRFCLFCGQAVDISSDLNFHAECFREEMKKFSPEPFVYQK